ncbi:hypothetical protein D9757_007002 [Collybiopsis confluens]|uniref:SUN domain-containing protein n=1 Tax=Collybiopsis confluens TaxID=2823264 RepID=A0A8H5HCR9_9AGAR|nr:hypothetical protein D9757_007002 [Collybiopsis confluens]
MTWTCWSPFLLLALYILPTARPAPSSPYDPFRAISLLATSQPDPLICCLTPLPPLEPVEEHILLSFEEWKEKQARPAKSSPNHTSLPSGEDAVPADNVLVSPPEILDSYDSDLEKVSPHFQVPLTDRFNYASMDCSARVHLAHRSAKSPSSILSLKRDRYMLSPCNSPHENQFVVVELCEDIRIDTVQLANFEFFSGVFKDFTVSVAKTYKEDWVTVGSYRAKNVRGVQSFHPPPSLTDFYRFIRVDFNTHYSNEYYCPISLLRVYGLTHLEEWKWEIWEAQSKAKRADPVDAPTPLPGEDTAVLPSLSSDISFSTSSQPSLAPFAWEQFISLEGQTTSVHETHGSFEELIGTKISTPTTSISLPSSSSSLSVASDISHTTTSSSSTGNATALLATPISSSAITSVVTTSQVHIPLPATGGESIYRTIMNRLTALEANHTLYVRYVEEQTNGVRDMIRRLAEDVGRLEGIGKAQAQRFQRSLQEWENQRKILEAKYDELAARVEYMSDDIVLEKRLGIAQLGLLLAVIVFMGLTRGSRAESLVEHGHLRFNRSMREWSRRHLSFSGDWVSRFKMNPSRSRSQSPSKPSRLDSAHPEHKIAFPSYSVYPRGLKSASHVHSKSHSSALLERKPRVQNVYLQNSSRSRTPSLRTPQPYNPRLVPRPITPTTLLSTAHRPQLQRANSLSGPSSSLPASVSWTGVGPVPKSAKRWARTAHLHEVKSPSVAAESKARMNQDEKENRDLLRSAQLMADSVVDFPAKTLNNNDVFLVTPSRTSRRSAGHPTLRASLASAHGSDSCDDLRWVSSPGSCDGEDGDVWVDTDITDTSVDGDGDGNS